MGEMERNLPSRFNLQIFSTFKIWLRTWDCYNITFIVKSSQYIEKVGHQTGADRLCWWQNSWIFWELLTEILRWRDQIYWAELYLELIQRALFRQFARWWQSHSSSTKLLISSNNFIQRHLIGNLNTKPTTNLFMLSARGLEAGGNGNCSFIRPPSILPVMRLDEDWEVENY